MRRIEGYLLTAKSAEIIYQDEDGVQYEELLFGPNSGESGFNHERFTTNGLIPYKTKEDAFAQLNGLHQRRDLKLSNVGVSYIAMEMVERDPQVLEKAFVGKSNIIIAGIFKDPDEAFEFANDKYPFPKEISLLGKKVGILMGFAHAPVTLLEYNNFQLFNSTSQALYALHQTERQVRMYCTLATFEMRRILVNGQYGFDC